MIIRPEGPADLGGITELTIAAFNTLPISQHTEQFIITALRRAGDLSLSLVAEIDGHLVGHVAFSPVALSDGTTDWYGLGPVSVLPDFQRQGIGSALIKEGLTRLETMGGRGCALVGDPAFYSRFGFRHCPELVLPGVPPEVFMVLPFGEDAPSGEITFHEAFLATE